VDRHALELAVDDEPEEQSEGAHAESHHQETPAVNAEKVDRIEIGNDEAGLATGTVRSLKLRRIAGGPRNLCQSGRRSHRAANERKQRCEHERHYATEHRVNPDRHL
jgi:hypothetical protein